MSKLIELSNLSKVSIDKLVKEKEIPEVIARELDHKKIDSFYNDVNRTKRFIKWYIIVFGTIAVIIAIILINFFVRSIFHLW